MSVMTPPKILYKHEIGVGLYIRKQVFGRRGTVPYGAHYESRERQRNGKIDYYSCDTRAPKHQYIPDSAMRRLGCAVEPFRVTASLRECGPSLHTVSSSNIRPLRPLSHHSTIQPLKTKP